MCGLRGAILQHFCCSIHLLKLPIFAGCPLLSVCFTSQMQHKRKETADLSWDPMQPFSSEAKHGRKNVLHTLKMQTVNYYHPVTSESSSCGAPPAQKLHLCTLESSVAKWKRSRRRGGFGDVSPLLTRKKSYYATGTWRRWAPGVIVGI